jgi:hypothetical protein
MSLRFSFPLLETATISGLVFSEIYRQNSPESRGAAFTRAEPLMRPNRRQR